MYSISPTTVAKWKERNYVHDSAMGPKVRRSKLAYVDLLKKAGKMEAAQFLKNLTKFVPYKIEKILTDNGIQFTNRKCDKLAFPQHLWWDL